jgi:hypothetical protein
MERVKRLGQVDYVTGIMGAMMLIVYWLIVATLPDFFFVSPSGEASQLRRAELILSTIGWILASTIAPIALFLYASGYHRARNILPYTALVWPVSLIISQVTVYILDGSFYFDYLAKFPIFIYTDLVLPIFIMMLWYDLRENGFANPTEAEQVVRTS